MAKQPWLEEVERRLAESRLPPAYIRRFMDELADHYQDILEETMSKEASVLSRLGNPEHVADAAVIAYKRQTLFGRHPSARFWIFGVSPMAAMLLAFVLACLGVAGLGEICQYSGLHTLLNKNISDMGITEGTIVFYAVVLATTVIPASLLTIVYCRLARRWNLGKKWMLASCGIVAIAAMLPFQNITSSQIPGESLWTIGLKLPPTLLQWTQLFVPLAVGLWFVCRSGARLSQEDRLRIVA